MANDAAVPRKYIMGWLRFRPGKREEFLPIYQRGAQATRKEPGCVFYDYGVSPTDPDLMYILECFASEEAHAEHLKTQHFAEVWAGFERLGVAGDFQDIWSDTFKVSDVRF